MRTASALAHPNIAFIKYWGNCDPDTRIPANGSISMNLDGLFSRTTVSFDAALLSDELLLGGQVQSGASLKRVSAFLDTVRSIAHFETYARVVSENNFPMGAGIASSASAFAALSMAASQAAGLKLNERQLSQLARTGSGSACRSIPGGFVEWVVAGCEADSVAQTIAPPEHWDLVDCVALISHAHKHTGSTEGHALAYTSLLQTARVADASRRLDKCRNAIIQRDFDSLAAIVELDSNLMHAVMMTSQPPIMYWQPATIAVMQAVTEWRQSGFPACYTIDAGPNVHVLCLAEAAEQATHLLRQVPGVRSVLTAHPGGPARVLADQAGTR